MTSDLTPDEVVFALTVAGEIPADEAAAWHRIGWTNLTEIRRHRNLGLAPRHAAWWDANGVTNPVDQRREHRKGHIGAYDLDGYFGFGITDLTKIRELRDAGWRGSELTAYAEAGIDDFDTAAHLRAHKVSGRDVTNFRALTDNPDDWVWLTQIGWRSYNAPLTVEHFPHNNAKILGIIERRDTKALKEMFHLH